MNAKQTLHQHLHGFSDEQFEEEMKHFPLCEVPYAIQSFADQQTTHLTAEVDRLKKALEEQTAETERWQLITQEIVADPFLSQEFSNNRIRDILKKHPTFLNQ